MLAIGDVEAADGAAGKAHRLQHLGVARVAVGDGVARHRGLAGGEAEALGQDFADDGQHRQHEGAGEGQRAEQRMQEVDEGEIDRHPRQIEQRRRPLAAEEAAHRIDVAAALQRLRGREAEARHVDRDPMRQRRDLLVEPRADAHQHLRADHVETALEQIEPDRQRREQQQRRDAAAGQRAVVDLHHVERPGQRQDVDHAGDQEQEQDDAAKSARSVRRGCAAWRATALSTWPCDAHSGSRRRIGMTTEPGGMRMRSASRRGAGLRDRHCSRSDCDDRQSRS